VKPGAKSTLQVFRRGAFRELAVTVVEFEAERPRAAVERASPKSAPSVGFLGLAVADLSDAQKRELNLKAGVRVESAEGVAARAGVREGDVILAIDNTEITGVKQFEAVVAKLDKSKAVNALVRRGDAATYVLIRPQR